MHNIFKVIYSLLKKPADQDQHFFLIVCACLIFSEDGPVCYGTSLPQNGDCVNTQYALLKYALLKPKFGCGDIKPPLIAKP